MLVWPCQYLAIFHEFNERDSITCSFAYIMTAPQGSLFISVIYKPVLLLNAHTETKEEDKE